MHSRAGATEQALGPSEISRRVDHPNLGNAEVGREGTYDGPEFGRQRIEGGDDDGATVGGRGDGRPTELVLDP